MLSSKVSTKTYEQPLSLSVIAWSAWRTRTVLLVAGATLARLVFIATNPLTDTEAYYASWARFLSASYYRHPPLIAWMIAATTAISKSSFGVRLGPVVRVPRFRHLFTSFIANPEAPLAPLWVLYLCASMSPRRLAASPARARFGIRREVHRDLLIPITLVFLRCLDTFGKTLVSPRIVLGPRARRA